MDKMNKSDLHSTESNDCKGRCLLEMQKTLDTEIIAEFLETVRDFYNDDEISSKIKNVIISETNEVIELINKKASDLCSSIDEIFLHRRQRQSSFYKLCHKLARKEGSCLPDESQCVCFSEENLRTYNVDSTSDSKMKLIFNLEAVKQAVGEMCGKLICTKCKRSSTVGYNKYSMNPECDCSAPTFSSQHKIHEAILDLCLNKDLKSSGDSWYLTHLKRDADYYKQKASTLSLSSDNSVESFEVISPDDIHSEVGMDICNLNSAKVFTGHHQSTLPINSGSKLSDSSCLSTVNACSQISSSSGSTMADVEFLNSLEDLPVYSLAIKSNNILNNELMPESYIKDVENKSSPSDIVKKSFSNYLNNNNSKFSNALFLKASNPKAEISDVFKYENCLKEIYATKASVNQPSQRYLSDEASVDHPLKNRPKDSLKSAFSSYFNEEDVNKWLLK